MGWESDQRHTWGSSIRSQVSTTGGPAALFPARIRGVIRLKNRQRDSGNWWQFSVTNSQYVKVTITLRFRTVAPFITLRHKIQGKLTTHLDTKCSVIIPHKQNIIAVHISGTTYYTGLHSFKTAQEWKIFQMHSLKFGSSNWLSCECTVTKLIARQTLWYCRLLFCI